MQTAPTLLADITVLVRKDLLEMVARVQVDSSFFFSGEYLFIIFASLHKLSDGPTKTFVLNIERHSMIKYPNPSEFEPDVLNTFCATWV